MTICECMDFCYDRGMCKVKIILWHVYPDELRREVVYNGPGDEIPDDLDEMEFDNYDVPSRFTMTFNVNVEHDMSRINELDNKGHFVNRPGKHVAGDELPPIHRAAWNLTHR